MATWKLFEFFNGTVVSHNLPVEADNITLSYRSDDEAEITVPIYGLDSVAQNSWKEYLKPYKRAIVCFDDNDNIIFAGPITKVDVDYDAESIKVLASGYFHYLSRVFVSTPDLADLISSSEAIYNIQKPALGIVREILTNASLRDNFPTNIVIPDNDGSTPEISFDIPISELPSIYDVIDDVSNTVNGVEFRFRPFMDEDTLKWELLYGTSVETDARYINLTETELSYDLDEPESPLIGLTVSRDGTDLYFNRMWIQAGQPDENTTINLSARYADGLDALMPVLENKHSFDVDIDDETLDAQFAAYLADGTTGSQDIKINVSSEDYYEWYSNIGKKIVLSGESYKATGFTGDYRLLEISFTTDDINISLVVQNIRSVRYPKIPNPKLKDLFTEPEETGSGNNTTGGSTIKDTANNFSPKQLYGDVPMSINSEEFAETGKKWAIDGNSEIITSLTGTVGVDYPKLNTISMADGGVVFGLDIDQMNSVLENKKNDMTENGSHFLQVPTHLDDFVATDLKIFMGQVSNGQLKKDFVLAKTIPASFFDAAASAFAPEVESGGFTWYVVGGAAAFNTKVIDNRLVIFMGAVARYSRVTTSAATLYQYQNYQIVLSINDDYTLGEPVITEFVDGTVATNYTGNQPAGNWFYSIVGQGYFYDLATPFLSVDTVDLVSAFGYHSIGTFLIPNVEGGGKLRNSRNWWKFTEGSYWRDTGESPINDFLAADQFQAICYNKSIYVSWDIRSVSGTPIRILRGKLAADGRIYEWDTVVKGDEYIQGVSGQNPSFFIVNGNLFYRRWNGAETIFYVRTINKNGSLGEERIANIGSSMSITSDTLGGSKIFGLDDYVYQFREITGTNRLVAVPAVRITE